ncbi:MAG: hypothetical protein AAB966_00335, partial [Patescibacteria group bacterium]
IYGFKSQKIREKDSCGFIHISIQDFLKQLSRGVPLALEILFSPKIVEVECGLPELAKMRNQFCTLKAASSFCKMTKQYRMDRATNREVCKMYKYYFYAEEIFEKGTLTIENNPNLKFLKDVRAGIVGSYSDIYQKIRLLEEKIPKNCPDVDISEIGGEIMLSLLYYYK